MKILCYSDGSYTIQDDNGHVRSRHRTAENMAWHYAFMIAWYDRAIDLLNRAAVNPPDDQWLSEYRQLVMPAMTSIPVDDADPELL